jgi:hypothetical protein
MGRWQPSYRSDIVKHFFSTLIFFAAHAAYAGDTPMQANGDFDVKLSPQSTSDAPPWGRQRIEKVFHGNLQGSGIGEMLAVRGDVQGSAAYVALEQVTATLNGRSGSFFLQHCGRMDRGTPSLTVQVVPDSGTGELKGLKGSMTIAIDGGKHHYVFSYSLP